MPLAAPLSVCSAWPAACGLLGFCFMRGQAELEFATIVAWLVVLLLLLLWLVVASFSFAAINLLLNATIWLPLRRLHSALSPSPHCPHCLLPPSCHCPLVRWSACPLVRVIVTACSQRIWVGLRLGQRRRAPSLAAARGAIKIS